MLVCLYLGVRRGFDCDLIVNPLIQQGRVTLEHYELSYSVEDGALELNNISGRPLTIDLPRWGKKIVLAAGESNKFS